ncbi:hypothetical protein L596_014510 [Steinernema carpocapsae]|uniref:Very-long-chain (3R)-3-hydroxyacyl-CoA dehydratase n=1 Tax=Steinernema carpocapsae TaxID=34508 RepID=A0A4U5NC68_STECR|nr:hypothetical protein L596_014510 [Steinernema carpocapsae]
MKPFELYLFLYNAIQVFGWGVIMVKTFNGFIQNQTFEQLYENVAFELQIFQTAAILEIVHAVVGFVRSPVGTTAMQVYSRVFVVWAILYKMPSSRSSIGVPMLLVAWSITEVVRYSFYALGLIKCVPYALTWMRYTFFIVLYVMGASGELFTMYASLPEVAEKKHFTVEMPNNANISFSFYWYLVIIMLTYIPGFPQMYLYMFSQRAKVLGTKMSKKQE